MLYFRYSNSDYRIKVIAANGNTTEVQVSNWDGNARAYQLSDGSVILFSRNHSPIKFTTYSSYQTLNNPQGTWPGSSYTYMPNLDFGIGNDTFICSLDNNAAFKFGLPLLRAHLGSSGNWTYTGMATIPEHLKLGFSNNYSGMFPLYSSVSAATPDKLLMHDQGSSGKNLSMKVIDFPTFTDI